MRSCQVLSDAVSKVGGENNLRIHEPESGTCLNPKFLEMRHTQGACLRDVYRRLPTNGASPREPASHKWGTPPVPASEKWDTPPVPASEGHPPGAGFRFPEFSLSILAAAHPKS